jgi:hypothetical protein
MINHRNISKSLNNVRMGASNINLQYAQPHTGLPKYATDTYITPPKTSTYAQMFRKQRNITEPLDSTPRQENFMFVTAKQPPTHTPGRYSRNLPPRNFNNDYYNYGNFASSHKLDDHFNLNSKNNNIQQTKKSVISDRRAVNFTSNKSSNLNKAAPPPPPPVKTKAVVKAKKFGQLGRMDLLDDLDVDIKEMLKYQTPIREDNFDHSFVNDFDDDENFQGQEGDHIFLDYTVKGDDEPIGGNSNREVVGGGGSTFRSLPISEIDESLVSSADDYLKQKIKLLQLENANMHSKIQKLQKKLVKKIDRDKF